MRRVNERVGSDAARFEGEFADSSAGRLGLRWAFLLCLAAPVELASGCGSGTHVVEPDGGPEAGLADAGPDDADAGTDAVDAGASLGLDGLDDHVVVRGMALAAIPIGFTYSGSGTPSFGVAAASIGTPTPILLPDGTLALTGSGASRTLVVDASDATIPGSYLVTITVSDGVAAAMTSFVLRVNAPPSIDVIADTGTVAGFALPSFGVGFYDDGLAPASVVFEATSSNPTFLADADILLGAPIAGQGGRGSLSVTLTPSVGGTGEADVTLTATDVEGESSARTFHVGFTATAANGVELVSRTSGLPATGGDGLSMEPAVSGDGRFVVFTSEASDLAGGSPSPGDLFVRDRQLATTARLGIAGRSGGVAITPDGRYLAFVSLATALVPGDSNGVADVFVHDRQSSTFERVSVTTGGVGADGPSSIDTEAGHLPFRRPAISDDGRFVVFESEATNLVAGDTNDVADVFVRDRQAQTTTRISVSTSGVEADLASTEVSVSGDGTVFAFESLARNLIDGSLEGATRADVFVWSGGVTTRASSASAGGPGNGASTAPSLSGSGRYLAFSSAATNLLAATEFFGKVDVYVLDRTDGTTSRINLDLDPAASQGDCYAPSISADGNRVTFQSDALLPNLVNGYINAFLFDRTTSQFTFIGKSLVGSAPNGGTGYGVRLASGGGFVVFQSSASNLFPGDANGAIDVFLQPAP